MSKRSKEWIYFNKSWIKANSVVAITAHKEQLIIDITSFVGMSFNCLYPNKEDFELAYDELCIRLGISDNEYQRI